MNVARKWAFLAVNLKKKVDLWKGAKTLSDDNGCHFGGVRTKLHYKIISNICQVLWKICPNMLT